MATRLRFFGYASFEIVTAAGLRLVIDPYLDASAVSPVRAADLERVDLLLVTHGAWDHLGDSAQIATRWGCPVVCGPEVKEALLSQGVPEEQLLSVAWGIAVDFRGLRIRPVESRHTSRALLADGRWSTGFPMGFIIAAAEETRIYHMGDTALFGDLRLIGELYRPNVVLAHVSAPDSAHAGEARVVTGEMTPYEAALACQWLQAEYAIPCHFLDPECEDVGTFVGLLERMVVEGKPGTKAVVLAPGEWWTH
jgi:L-ascorbate metabolism protein UlaG (beta-lactamase superfamily)